MITHGSLFTGIGGFDLAARWQGIPTLWMVEKSASKCRFLQNEFPESRLIQEDISRIDPSDLPPVDIVSIGFPCQDISIANSNAKGIKGKRSGLWSEAFRLVCSLRPKVILIENVPALNRRGLSKVLWDLAKIRYDAQWTTLSCRQFGAPHLRERLFVVAYNPSQIGRKKELCEAGDIAERIRKKEGSLDRWGEFTVSDCWEDWRPVLQQLCSMDDGLPPVLRAAEIEGFGDAVSPVVASFLFSQIKPLLAN